MPKAIIIFADGSKQMSHNMDDSRLRWHERKLIEADDILKHFAKGLCVRDCSSPTDLVEARAWKSELVKQQASISQSLAYVKREVPSQYMNKTIAMRVAMQEIMLQNTHLKAWFQDNDETHFAGKSNDELRDELIQAQAEIIRLQRILIEQFNIDEGIVIRLSDKTG